MQISFHRSRLTAGLLFGAVALILAIVIRRPSLSSSHGNLDMALADVSGFLGTNLPKAYFWNGSVTKGEYAFYGFVSKQWRSWRRSRAPLPDTMTFLEVNRPSPFLAVTLVVRHTERVDSLDYSVAVLDARGRVIGFNDRFATKGREFGYIRLTTDNPPGDLTLPLEVKLTSPGGLQVDTHFIRKL